MSQKTYCDRCGAECAYRTGHLHLAEYHRRASGETVSQDEYKPFDLCGACIDELREFLGDALIVQHYDQADSVMARAVPQPFYPPDVPVTGDDSFGPPDSPVMAQPAEAMNVRLPPPFSNLPPAPRG